MTALSGLPSSQATGFNDEIHLAVGGVVMRITAQDPALALTLPGATGRFAVPPADPDIRVEAHWDTLDVPQPDTLPSRLLFDAGGLWTLHESGGRFIFTFTSPRFGSTPYKRAEFTPDFSTGTVRLHRPYFDPGEPVYPLEYPLDEIVMTNWLALGRGVEVHACAVADADGSGYLFAGHSGAGKTTIARTWMQEPGVTILSDDRVILRMRSGGVWMYGTPWHGDEPLAATAAVPLTRGFFLRQAPENQHVPLRRADIVARLLARSFPPFFSARALDFTLSLLDDVSQLAPFGELACRPDASVLDVIRAQSRASK